MRGRTNEIRTFFCISGVIAAAAAHGIHGLLGWNWWVTWIIGFPLASLGLFLVVKFWDRLVEFWHRDAANRLAKEKSVVFQLSVAEARERVEQIARGPMSPFVFTTATGPPPAILLELAAQMRGLLERYEQIADPDGEMTIARSQIAHYEKCSDFIWLGEDYEGAQLLIAPHDETIFWITGYEITEAELRRDAYPSIYHFLLCSIDPNSCDDKSGSVMNSR